MGCHCWYIETQLMFVCWSNDLQICSICLLPLDLWWMGDYVCIYMIAYIYVCVCIYICIYIYAIVPLVIWFYFFLSDLDAFYIFFLSNWYGQKFSVILNSSGEDRHPCFVPDLSGKVFSLSDLIMLLSVGFS